MAKYILIILSCLQVFAADKPDLLKQMETMRVFFAAHKPVEKEEVIQKFPETMRMIGYAIQSKTLGKQARVHAIVALAAATVPFDDGENTAANVMSTDYAKKDMTELYEKELAAIPDEAIRNRLTIGLHKIADTAPN